MTINQPDMTNLDDNAEIIDLDNMGDIFGDEQPVVEEGIDNEL